MAFSRIDLPDYGKEIEGLVDERLTHEKTNKPLVVYLEGGHFDPRYTEEDDLEFAKASLRGVLAVAQNLIVKFNKDVRVVLGVLVDDLGLHCGEDTCSLDDRRASQYTDGTLPPSLEEILTSSSVLRDRKRVQIHHERKARNRGLKTLKQLVRANVHDALVSKEADSGKKEIHFNNANGAAPVLLATVSGHLWAAQCPLIMGQHYKDVDTQLRQRFPGDNSHMIIDVSEKMDEAKVTNGSQVAQRVFLTGANRQIPQISNIFFWDDEGSRHNTVNFPPQNE